MSKLAETVKKKYLKRDDYIGKKFNMLTVIEFDHADARSQSYFKCRCDCGNVVVVKGGGLTTGNNKSCGCLHKKCIVNNFPKYRKDQTTHGECKTRLYRIWANMKDRCKAVGKPNGKNYADRGIRVCEEWKKFEVFREWALSNGYEESLSIDRIDVDGNYEPSNCRWVDSKRQSRNRRNTFYVEYKGVIMPLKDACEITGRPYQTAYKRIVHNGMSVEDALHTKSLKKGRGAKR